MKDDGHVETKPCEFKYSFKKIRNYLGLTDVQLNTITAGKKVNRFKYQIGNKTVSKGSYYRVRDQAITNITKSIMTMTVLISCDIISHDDLITIITTTAKLIDEGIHIEEIFFKLKEYFKKTIKFTE
ncbi:MAG TPA: hypothetical protein EYH44_00415 [Thermoprotei archaeon]|nr:hypothetical protein [Thermoprotei archaeon]